MLGRELPKDRAGRSLTPKSGFAFVIIKELVVGTSGEGKRDQPWTDDTAREKLGVSRGLWNLRDKGRWFLSGGSAWRQLHLRDREKRCREEIPEGNEPRPAQNWERSGHLQGKAPMLIMS